MLTSSIPCALGRQLRTKAPHVNSPRARPRVELVRPVPEGSQPQLLGDAGQLAVPSMLRRRAQTPYNDFGTH
jgi:hypothetical protein